MTNINSPKQAVKELTHPPSFSEKSLFAQGVHASVRPQQKDQISNGSGNSLPRTITKSAPQGKMSLGEKAQRSGFFPSVAQRVFPQPVKERSRKMSNDAEDTGAAFVRSIKPLGAAIFLLMFVLFLITCFTSGPKGISGYEAAFDYEYYSENIDALYHELSTHIFPAVEGITSSRIDGNMVLLTIEKQHFFATRSTILKYFDKRLFSFLEE